MPWLLCWYTAEERSGGDPVSSVSFRAVELRSLAVRCGVDPARITMARPAECASLAEVGAGHAAAPGWVREAMAGRSGDPTLVPVHFDTDLTTAGRIAQHSVLLKALLEVWGTGLGLSRCVQATAAASAARGGTPSDSAEVATQSFRLCIQGIGCKISRDQQRAAIDALLPVCGMTGEVKMTGAECVLWYIADRWEAQTLAHRRRLGKAAAVAVAQPGGSTAAGAGAGAEQPQQQPAPADDFVVFAREVSSGSRDLLEKMALSERRYLGPTTMAPATALVTANLAAIKPGALVLDPCCGSGSMLLAAAAIGGAICVGADANPAVLKGEIDKRRNKGHTPTSNFEQYGLTHLCAGWATADLTRPPFGAARRQVFDAVVCDPPYGLREGERSVEAELVGGGSTDLFGALVELAGAVLVGGGRMVYWRPVGVGGDAEAEQKRHEEEASLRERCGFVEVFRGEVTLSRRLRGHGKKGKGRGKAPKEHGGADYATDREAGRERRHCVVLEKRKG